MTSSTSTAGLSAQSATEQIGDPSRPGPCFQAEGRVRSLPLVGTSRTPLSRFPPRHPRGGGATDEQGYEQAAPEELTPDAPCLFWGRFRAQTTACDA